MTGDKKVGQSRNGYFYKWLKHARIEEEKDAEKGTGFDHYTVL